MKLPQDGRMKLKMGSKETDVRISICNSSWRKSSFKLRSGDKELNLSNLGFPDNKLSKFKNGLINHME